LLFLCSFATMEIRFYKYHGTGNDFILIDNREEQFDGSNQSLIAAMCHRHFGIGADGLILLENMREFDFSMRYFNADGFEGSMCGNGGRCVVAFAKKLGIIEDIAHFDAIDGLHQAHVENELISLQMINVTKIEKHATHYFLDTGSPHHVALIDGLDVFPVMDKGRQIRYDAPYYDKGSNVNFVEQRESNSFKVRTYERGVENETLSCGTGVTAVAIAMFEQGKTTSNRVELETLGGKLEVSFTKSKKGFHDIYLKGPATFVFEGIYHL